MACNVDKFHHPQIVVHVVTCMLYGVQTLSGSLWPSSQDSSINMNVKDLKRVVVYTVMNMINVV